MSAAAPPAAAAAPPQVVPAATSASADQRAGGIIISDDDPFDWEAYISAYRDRTKVARLLFLAQSSPSLRVPAADAALTLIRQGRDLRAHQDALTIRNQLPPGVKADRVFADQAWASETERANKSEVEKLEMELRGYQNNMIKESIRMGHRDMAHHFRSIGLLNEAFKCYVRTREFCSTSEHIVEMCLGVIEVSLELQNYSQVSTYVSKAEGVLESWNPDAAAASASLTAASAASSGIPGAKGSGSAGGDAIGALFRSGGSATASDAPALSMSAAPGANAEKGKKELRELSAKLGAANGIASLGQRYYEQAARKFLSLPSEAAGNGAEALAHIISPADIAIYAVLCALATFSRSALRTEVVERAAFRPFLEHAPHARELLDAFHTLNYKRGLEILDRWKSRHLLDIHLAPHIHALTNMLTRKALQQFVTPFDSVPIARMAAAFGWTERSMLDEIVALIQHGEIDARLDWTRKVLEARKVDERTALFDKAIEVGEQRVKVAKRLLFRMEVVENDLVIKSPHSMRREP